MTTRFSVSTILAVGIWMGIALVGLVPPTVASRPKMWIDTRQADFAQGEMRGVLISSTGEIQLALAFEQIADLNEAVVWDVWMEDATLYVATGHQGRVYAIDTRTLKVETIIDLDEPEAQALVFWDGALYVAANPGAHLYRWTPTKRSVEPVWQSQEAYIWDLAVWQGNLYVATGDQGRLFRIGKDGKPVLVLDTTDQNLVRLWADATGLYVGAAGVGTIYRLAPDGKPVAIYPADRIEVSAIARGIPKAGWTLALATIGTPLQPTVPTLPPTQPPSPPPRPSRGTSTSETVIVSKEVTPSQSPPTDQARPDRRRPSPLPPVTYPISATLGKRGGAVWALDANLRLFPLWTTRKHWIYDIEAFRDEIWIATGNPARIVSIDAQRQIRYQAAFKEEQVVRLLARRDELWAATSNPARIYRARPGSRQKGVYTSPVKDAGFMAFWGSFHWRGVVPQDGQITCYARSGNTSQPDETWTDWQGPLASEGPLSLPPGRYFQYRCELQGSFENTPRLQEVRITFLPQNRPPRLTQVSVLPPGSVFREAPGTSKPRIAGSERAALEHRPPRPSPEAVRSPPDGSAPRPGKPPGVPYTPSQAQYKWGMQTVVWQAEDPDGDDLVYTLYIQRADEQTWHLLKSDWKNNIFAWDTTSLPDGWYRLRIVASDERTNPPGHGLQTEIVTPLFLVDHTPPRLRLIRKEKAEGGWFLRLEAQDSLSPITRAEYATEPDRWYPLYSVDRILDTRREVLELHLANPSGVWTTVQVRVCDAGQNCTVLSVDLSQP